jgi:predicted thioredoxin/glutaredoxin
MNLQQKIKELCQAIMDSESNEAALYLAHDLLPLLHRRLQELRESTGARMSKAS